MKKNFLVIAILILSCFINVNTVNGAEIDCTNQSFECITCTYEPTGVNTNQRFTYYAVTDGRGTVTVDYVGTQSNLIRWSASTTSSSFVSNNKLVCPTVYMKNVGGQSQAIDVSTSRKTNYIASTLLDSTDNGRPFKDLSVSEEEQAKTCKDIPIVIYSSGIPGNVTRSTYYNTGDYASAMISGDKKTKNLELPGKYSAASSWQNVKDDDISNCNNLIVGCFEQDIGAYGDKKYTCYLDSKSVLDDRIETDSQHQLIPEKEESHTFNSDIYTDEFDNNCHDFAGALKIIGRIIFVAKIVLPLLIIVKSSLNLVHVVTKGDSGEFKKQATKAGVSLVAAVLVFLVPTFLNAIFSLVDNANDTNNSDAAICRACVFDPGSNTCTDAIK